MFFLQQIKYKLFLLTYKALHGKAPAYLSQFCIWVLQTAPCD